MVVSDIFCTFATYKGRGQEERLQTPTRDDQTGEIIRHYTTTKKMLEGITFEETHENAVTSPTPTPPEP